jgi:CubicO group peptidase (beta-lactamase class C family)
MAGVEHRLALLARRHRVAGAMVGVLDRGQTEGAATGFADAGTGRPLNTRSVAHVASVTKPVVATSFVLAAGSSLDTPVIELVPELRAGWRASTRLTPRQLLSHTSGLHRDLTAFTDGEDGLEQAVRGIVGRRQELRPGRAWRYCNGGFWLAGLALARLTGQRFEDAVQATVLRPAAMANSGFERPELAALGHIDGRADSQTYVPARRPGGGLCSTVGDLLRFAEFLLERPALLATMTAPIARTTLGSCYGLGWELQRDLIWHKGSWGGYRSCLLLAPAHRFAAVALVNEESGARLVRNLVSAELSAATGLPSPWKGMSRFRIAAGAGSRVAWAKATRFMP